MNHHPTWEEVRDEYFRDAGVRAAYDSGEYMPVARAREAERTRLEQTVAGYREARSHGSS